MLFKDEAEKQRRGYTDPKSFVRNDGSEVLHGEDWKKRKNELQRRAIGRCEFGSPWFINWEKGMTRCPNEAADPHHIKPRSKGRDDRLSNLQALCRYHHDLLDQRKPRWKGATA